MKTFKSLLISPTLSGISFLSGLSWTIGLFFILLSIRLFFDWQAIKSEYFGESSDNKEYLVLTKKLSFLNTLGVGSNFNQKDIKKISIQPFVESVAGFQNSNYRVTLSSSKFNFRTYLFFESIEEDFIDAPTDAFQWQEGDGEIPIILSNEFFNLYNFGFAVGQGMPKVSKEILMSFQFDISLNGNGRTGMFKGRIVGFSDRITSVLVPQEFMTWSNKVFGSAVNGYPRVMLKVNNSGHPSIEPFLKANHYEVNREKLSGKTVNRVFNSTISVVALLSVVIVILSIVVTIITTQLQVTRQTSKIKLLLNLGYEQKEIAQVFWKRFLGVKVSTALLVVMFYLFADKVLSKFYNDYQISIATNHAGIILAVGFSLTAVMLVYYRVQLKKTLASLK